MKQTDRKFATAKSVRSLPVSEWPEADRHAWQDACRPGHGLRRGGPAGRFAEVSRDDFARRYGAFLGFLQRSGSLDLQVVAAAQVTPSAVESYVTELNERVRSVTVWNCIYKLRMAAKLLDPKADFSWLAEIEKDLALVMVPRSKFERLVLSDRLVEAGLTLVAEAESYAKSAFERAKGIRNGLMIALLAACPSRVKNFADLEIGVTFKEVDGGWWISLPFKSTKTKGSEERPVPEFLNRAIDLYLKDARPMLIGSRVSTNSLWISSRTGQRYTTKNLGTLISKITFRTIGVDVSPHLFRTAAATTAAMYGGDNPYLASAVLGHHDSRVTYENYIRAKTVNATKEWGAIVRQYHRPD
jgi:site-specific recombinase XerD